MKAAIRKLKSVAGKSILAFYWVALFFTAGFACIAKFMQDTYYYHFWSWGALIAASLCAFACAVHRWALYHPSLDPRYWKWLKMTPWTWRKPLPLGPAVPTMGDYAGIVAVTVMCVWALPKTPPWDLRCGLPVLVFVGTSIVIGTMTLLQVWQFRPVYFIFLGLAAALDTIPQHAPLWALPVLACIYPFVTWNVVRTLRKFPWKHETRRVDDVGHYRSLSAAAVKREKGFFLSPAWAAMVGVWTYVLGDYGIMWAVPLNFPVNPFVGLVYFCLVLILLGPYALAYFGNGGSSFGMMRWVWSGFRYAPNFNRVKWLPYAALAVGLGLPFWMHRHGVPLSANLALCAFGEAMILCAGPRPGKWLLTGDTQIRLPKPDMRFVERTESAETRSGQFQKSVGALSSKFFPPSVRAAFSGRPTRTVRPRSRRIEPTYLRVIPKLGVWMLVIFCAIFAVLNTPLVGWGRQSAQLVMIIALFDILYGAIRVLNFHPASDWGRDYREWLKLVPWDASRPLPFGPVHLVWQDMVAIFALGITPIICLSVAFGPPRSAHGALLVTGIIFGVTTALVLGAYCLGALIIFIRLGRMDTMAVIAFLFGCGFLYPRLWSCAAILLAITVVCDFGLMATLKDFPWEGARLIGRENSNGRQAPMFFVPLTAARGVSPIQSYLAPKIELDLMSRRNRIVTSLSIGWLIFCFCRFAQMRGGVEPVAFAALVWIFLTMFLFRMLAYYTTGKAPISLWGRLLTGRWIIWRFDGPLFIALGLLVGSLTMPGVMHLLRVPVPVNMAVSATVGLLLFTLVGPSLTSWLLTGGHRAPQ